MQGVEVKKLWIRWLEEEHSDDKVYQELLKYNSYCDEKNFPYNPYLYSYALLVYFKIHKKYSISPIDLYLLLHDEKQAYSTVLCHYYKNEATIKLLPKMNSELSKETVSNFLEGCRVFIAASETPTNT